MIRTHGRIWIGLLAWLLMQTGLLVASFPVTARAQAVMMPPHTATAAPHCRTPPAPPVHMAHTHHKQDPCCHVHVSSTDMPAPPATLLPPQPGAGMQSYLSPPQARLAGGDWLPPMRPPKYRNAQAPSGV
ncbi:hypothetical protein LU298_01965 [Komagataeibacter intermedius]|uniref:DUF2946 domain-containing protein n=2 Tax=Komagataeibacter intermedius TaxID=66229 RepID=A0A0N0ME90_9PROT|nr:hypothetical protein [Komagataeibacter intermedius]KPH86206.1 hypothetical protein GLUCOINTEAF2_0202905 [Komagataeibacter intermedius AF2]MCF3635274.1 hypothetical protein [Komagataeibacter intermedius]GAN87295.1 hypothetical protein Gain_0057_007 [Komagataeibacter intermedius TF2]GBQ69876.1 hypothetical protein AA0521_1555 [Komagataeibacter intermedius NRIC 0521]